MKKPILILFAIFIVSPLLSQVSVSQRIGIDVHIYSNIDVEDHAALGFYYKYNLNKRFSLNAGFRLHNFSLDETDYYQNALVYSYDTKVSPEIYGAFQSSLAINPENCKNSLFLTAEFGNQWLPASVYVQNLETARLSVVDQGVKEYLNSTSLYGSIKLGFKVLFDDIGMNCFVSYTTSHYSRTVENDINIRLGEDIKFTPGALYIGVGLDLGLGK